MNNIGKPDAKTFNSEVQNRWERSPKVQKMQIHSLPGNGKRETAERWNVFMHRIIHGSWFCNHLDGRDGLGGDAAVTHPLSRVLPGQQVVGHLAHTSALPVEPSLTATLTVDGFVIVIHLSRTHSAGVGPVPSPFSPGAPSLR